MSEFLNFINDKDITKMIISLVLAREVNFLTTSLVDDIIMPIINIDVDCDGDSDLNTLKNLKFEVMGAKVAVGNFLITTIKSAIILYVVFMVFKLFKKNK
jgi:large-conductance mechanosensitive channel